MSYWPTPVRTSWISMASAAPNWRPCGAVQMIIGTRRGKVDRWKGEKVRRWKN